MTRLQSNKTALLIFNQFAISAFPPTVAFASISTSPLSQFSLTLKNDRPLLTIYAESEGYQRRQDSNHNLQET